MILEEITYSSDSTSHKHIEYECRTIALQVINYSDPSTPPEWKSHTLGIGTSINHTSQTQVDGLKQCLQELAEVFNNSELAKQEGLRFIPDDFAFRLIGTSGDHAADQKKSHEIHRTWRLEVILMRLGEEALLEMDVGPLSCNPYFHEGKTNRVVWRTGCVGCAAGQGEARCR